MIFNILAGIVLVYKTLRVNVVDNKIQVTIIIQVAISGAVAVTQLRKSEARRIILKNQGSIIGEGILLQGTCRYVGYEFAVINLLLII